jgi:hypothetical protein
MGVSFAESIKRQKGKLLVFNVTERKREVKDKKDNLIFLIYDAFVKLHNTKTTVVGGKIF